MLISDKWSYVDYDDDLFNEDFSETRLIVAEQNVDWVTLLNERQNDQKYDLCKTDKQMKPN